MTETAKILTTIGSIEASICLLLCLITFLTGWLNGGYFKLVKKVYLACGVGFVAAGLIATLVGA